MSTTFHRVVPVLLVIALSPLAAAQTRGTDDYLAVVTADNVYVRSGADFGYYPIGTLDSGAVVKVTGHRGGWARLALVGPAFKDFFGYVKHQKIHTPRLRLDPGGRTGLTLGRVDVIGPNHQFDGDPDQSWKWLARMTADQRLRVLRTLETERDVVHVVALPAGAEGWITEDALRPADGAEIIRWQNAVADAAEGTPTTAEIEEPPAVVRVPEDEVERIKEDAGLAETTSADAIETLQTPATETPVPQGSPAFEVEPAVEIVEPALVEATPVVVDESEPSAHPDDAERFETLEADLAALRAKTTRTHTEVDALAAGYGRLAAEAADSPQIARYSEARARQLRLMIDIDHRRTELDAVRQRVDTARHDAAVTFRSIESRLDYTAVGRLEASNIYRGGDLPRLYRLRDVGSGRTIAYLRPERNDGEQMLTAKLGQVVGVTGEKAYDGGLRLTLIEPRRIEVLEKR